MKPVRDSAGDDLHLDDRWPSCIYKVAADGAELETTADAAGIVERSRDTHRSAALERSQDPAADVAAGTLLGVEGRFTEGRFGFARSGGDVHVALDGDAGGSLAPKDFRDGDFGIRFQEPVAEFAPRKFDDCWKAEVA